MENEKSVLRWGGLAGILAFIIWIIDMPIYMQADPFTPQGLMRFPDVRVTLAINTILCMTTAFLSIALVLVLYRTLRETSQTLSLFGSVLGVIGYIGIALSDAYTFYAFAPLSDIYHDPVATLEAQAMVELLWQATQGIPHTFVFIGSLFLMMGFIALGLAMMRSPVYGRRLGGMSIALGVGGGVCAILSLLVFETIGIMFIADLIFLLMIGRKVYSLSKESRSPIT
jgi:hypothetical protein